MAWADYSCASMLVGLQLEMIYLNDDLRLTGPVLHKLAKHITLLFQHVMDINVIYETWRLV